MMNKTTVGFILLMNWVLFPAPPILSEDTITINQSFNEGMSGTSFVPSNFFGFGNHCSAVPGGTSSGAGAGVACFEVAGESLDAWFTGGYFDSRAGTDVIPPMGTRSGWRLMMEDHFSPGAFLTGFAPFLNQFPNFPQVGTPGPSGYDPDLLLLFLDHHGEPLTPGRFPRYIPHERQAWVDTLMVKFVASSSGEFSQAFRSQVGGFRGDGTPSNTVTWMSMSNESAETCGSDGTCLWTFDVGADGKGGTTDDILSREVDGTVTVVTSSLRISSFFAIGDGTVDIPNVPLSPIEGVPSVIDDRLDQSLSQVGDSTVGLQVLRYQFQAVSGPNFHAEEGNDPYTWVICGSRVGGAGEEDCDSPPPPGTIIEESTYFAFLSGGTYGEGSVYSHSDRIGPDGRFFTSDDGAGMDGVKGTVDDTIVMCTGASGATMDGSGNPFWGADCDSDPGPDLVYGTSDDGIIYWREAVENGFRLGTRENRAFAFSFIDSLEQLRQIMEQYTEPDQFLMSCLNCNLPPLPSIGPLNYDQLLHIPTLPPPGFHPPNPSESFDLFVPIP